MSKKNDDSIERIFRKAVTQYEPTFVESDWLKMEKMLDEEASRRAAIRSKRIRGAAYTLTGLMGLVVAVYFLVFNNPSDSVERVSPLSPELRAEEDHRSNGNVEKETSSSGLLSSSDKDSAQEETIIETPRRRQADTELAPSKQGDQRKKYLTDKRSNLPSEISNSAFLQKDSIAKRDATFEDNGDELPGHFPEVSGENKMDNADELNADSGIRFNNDKVPYDANSVATQTSDRNDHSSHSLEQPSTPLPTSPVAIDNQNSSPIEKVRSEERNATTNGELVIHPDSALSQLSNSRNEMFNPDLSNSNLTPQDTDTVAQLIEQPGEINNADSLRETPTRDKHKVKPSSRWTLGLLFAPEFSTTRLNHYSTPGQSLGLRIGYQFTNRFSVNTGIIRSAKKYKDDAGEYNTNPNYWKNRTNGVIPEEIDGQCLVLEIPLDLQFDIISTQKSRVFASAGMSSYFMLSQSYRYKFETPNPGADTGWSTSKSESYWFGVGVVSAGYERNIHPALMIGLEPYLKVALTEVGWSNINLLSTGAYVTLRYKFIGK